MMYDGRIFRLGPLSKPAAAEHKIHFWRREGPSRVWQTALELRRRDVRGLPALGMQHAEIAL